MREYGVPILLTLAAAACQREALAQGAVTRDPLGPIRCLQIATGVQLSQQSALEICAGAINEAPGQCYAYSIDNFHNLSSQKVMSLCVRATNMEPAYCYGRLQATGVVTEDQAIAYCTTTCALGPPPAQSSNPDCMHAALERSDLSLQLAGELCDRASSAGPVECFLAGQDLHNVADSSLIPLCQELARCQYSGGGSYSAAVITGAGY